MEKKDQIKESRTIFEKLLYIGIATFFLWPFVQLWSVNAIPLFPSDNHLRASIALENLMENELAKPFVKMNDKVKFKPIKGYEDMKLLGRVHIFPHPDFENMSVIRAQVRWGSLLLPKSMSLEYLRVRTKP